MPQHKSCEKRMKTSLAARTRNRRDRSQCRLAIKQVLSTNDKSSAATELSKVFALLDRMVAKGLYHQNTVARRKAMLTRHVNLLQS